jgi:hypothetical protein
MNSWIENLLDIDDMRRRCAAHDQWMRAHPDATAFSEAWADRNLDELADVEPIPTPERHLDNGHRHQRARHLLHGVQRDFQRTDRHRRARVRHRARHRFGVDLGENDWAALGLVTSLRKARLILSEHRRRIDVQALTDVNNMLFKILATPDR